MLLHHELNRPTLPSALWWTEILRHCKQSRSSLIPAAVCMRYFSTKQELLVQPFEAVKNGCSQPGAGSPAAAWETRFGLLLVIGLSSSPAPCTRTSGADVQCRILPGSRQGDKEKASPPRRCSAFSAALRDCCPSNCLPISWWPCWVGTSHFEHFRQFKKMWNRERKWFPLYPGVLWVFTVGLMPPFRNDWSSLSNVGPFFPLLSFLSLRIMGEIGSWNPAESYLEL